jgi:CheY-like chemotaxis protein
MPVLDGRQLIAALHQDRDLPRVPILITSGVVGVNEIADLLDMGATKFVPKPISMESFRNDVVQCLAMGPVLNGA